MYRLFIALVFLAAEIAAPRAGELRSGYQDASPQTQGMQDDDTVNPGFLWVETGKALWSEPAGGAKRSCASCHEIASMRGVSARYPAFDRGLSRPVTIEQRINLCRERHQQAEPLKAESEGLLALSALIGLQSRGIPVDVRIDGPMQSFFEAGAALFHRRQGQLNLSCSQCHDQLAGRRLAGALIPQGHPNGYPLYRLEWQSLGSFYRRLRNCLIGVRAEPYDPDSAELANIELYLAARARGLKIETPAVRP